MVELFVYSTFLSNTTCPLRSFELLLADARIDTQTWGALWQWPEWVAEMCPLGREIQPDMGDSVEKGGTSMQGKCQGGKLGRADCGSYWEHACVRTHTHCPKHPAVPSADGAPFLLQDCILPAEPPSHGDPPHSLCPLACLPSGGESPHVPESRLGSVGGGLVNGDFFLRYFGLYF